MRWFKVTRCIAAIAVIVAVGISCSSKKGANPSDPNNPNDPTHTFDWVERFATHAWNPKVLVSNGSKVLAIGADSIFQSSDGAAWTSTPSFSTGGFFGPTIIDAVWNGTKFIAIEGTTAFVSTDGVSWATVATPAVHTLHAIATNGGLTVAVGENGTILTTPDGVIWTNRPSPTTKHLNDVTWTGVAFTTVGDSSAAYTSVAGTVWSELPTGLNQNLKSIYWTGAQYVVSGLRFSNGATYIHSSSDGLLWSSTNTDIFFGNGYGGFAFASHGAQHIAVTTSYTAYVRSELLTSPDATTWTDQRGLPSMVGLRDALWFNTRFVAISGKGSIVTSFDGANWDIALAGGDCTFLAVTSSGTKYVAVGSIFATSDDGIAWEPHLWSQHAQREQVCATVAWSGSMFVAAGYLGQIFTSPDGEQWLDQSLSDSVVTMHKLLWVDGQFVGVGQDGALTPGHVAIGYTSPDGTTWTVSRTSTTMAFLFSAAAKDGMVTAVGFRYTNPPASLIYQSTNGTTWSEWPGAPMAGVLRDITASTDNFVTCGDVYAGIGLWRSPDGTTWQRASEPDTTGGLSYEAIRQVEYAGAAFYAFGSRGVLRSTDGLNWDMLNLTSSWATDGGVIEDVHWVGDRFLMVGASGFVVGITNGIFSSVETID